MSPYFYSLSSKEISFLYINKIYYNTPIEQNHKKNKY